jgi:hypothetical protein
MQQGVQNNAGNLGFPQHVAPHGAVIDIKKSRGLRLAEAGFLKDFPELEWMHALMLGHLYLGRNALIEWLRCRKRKWCELSKLSTFDHIDLRIVECVIF